MPDLPWYLHALAGCGLVLFFIWRAHSGADLARGRGFRFRSRPRRRRK